jgi:hypothetical protein
MHPRTHTYIFSCTHACTTCTCVHACMYIHSSMHTHIHHYMMMYVCISCVHTILILDIQSHRLRFPWRTFHNRFCCFSDSPVFFLAPARRKEKQEEQVFPAVLVTPRVLFFNAPRFSISFSLQLIGTHTTATWEHGNHCRRSSG